MARADQHDAEEMEGAGRSGAQPEGAGRSGAQPEGAGRNLGDGGR